MKLLRFTFAVTLCFITLSSLCQQFTPHQINQEGFELPQALHMADLDGDADVDLIVGYNGNLLWYENYGNGLFSESQIVSDDVFPDPRSISSFDMDSDGDNDILMATANDVVYFENTQSVFGLEQVIPTLGSGMNFVKSMDVDNDEDQDVIVTAMNSPNISWYENMGGELSLTEIVISNSESECLGIELVDMDNDGDNDIVASSGTNYEISWYECLENGLFGPQQLIFDIDWGYLFFDVGDVDADGFQDIVFTAPFDSTMSWIPNYGDGFFGSPVPVLSDEPFLWVVFVHDIDTDGDIDILYSNETQLLYFKNEGNAEFSPPIEIGQLSGYISDVLAIDYDFDGDDDLVTFSTSSDEVIIFENTQITGIEVLETSIFSFYPNPSSELITIITDGVQTDLVVEIIDLTGRVLHSSVHASEDGVYQVEREGIPPGLYNLTISTAAQSHSAKVVLE